MIWELMEFLVHIFNGYMSDDEITESFAEYAEKRLLETFSIK